VEKYLAGLGTKGGISVISTYDQTIIIKQPKNDSSSPP
jgi:hypothetical protein|tara:strand:- start:4873 stop:4986 length:114 start_codon:yes stop_codon:yes gene_type:complete